MSAPGMLTLLLLAAALASGCGGGAEHARDHQRARPTAAIAAHRPKPARPKPARPKPVSLTVEVNGDLLIHSPVWKAALQYGHGTYDFSPMLREIAPYIRRADLAICHVETPMTPRPPT